MEKEKIIFIKQMLNSLENKIKELETLKKNNDPRRFNEVKKDSFNIHEEISKIIK